MISDNTWGQAVIEKAMLYAKHEWYATDKNVKHGLDEAGRYISKEFFRKGFVPAGL